MHEELGKNYLNALKQFDPANPESPKIVDALVKGMDRPPTKQIDDIVAYIGEQARVSAAAVSDDSARAHRSAAMSLGIMILATVLLGGAIVWWMVLGITRPLTQAIGIAKTVAAGDLRTEVVVQSKDEVGELLNAHGHRCHCRRFHRDRFRQSGSVLTHGGTGQFAGGDGFVDGGADQHRAAEQ
jgi:methyl-accepting chemotaxis protein-1 (serine sensor receptor)